MRREGDGDDGAGVGTIAGTAAPGRGAHVDDERELRRTWDSPPGVRGWFSAVNHRVIGLRFIVTAFVFLLVGGALALAMRFQLMRPDATLLTPEQYNQIFTMHGITMMFLFAVPMGEGFAIYITPLMIGTRDMAFPRMNAFGYYVYLIGGIALYAAFILGVAPDAGWFNYPTLSGKEHSPGYGIDVYTTIITFVEVSALVAAVEIVATILKQRAPGMALHRMPLFVWAILVTAIMILFAMPGVIVASVMLALDRIADTQFFVPSGGGDALLWQHLFWWFGHPEVYIILLPALGFVSSIVTAFARRPVFGYTPLALSLVATGFISFGLWVHHMFTTGIPELGSSFFTAASMLIAVPAGVQIFCWIATLWGGRPVFRTPLLFVIGFLLIFVVGGVSGVMVASVQFDSQVHDTYFVVAHFHYVLFGGMVFPLFGAFYHWFPKITGKLLSERLGKWNFWLLFVGFNVTFFPMHQLGFDGMPRRVYTYADGMGWNGANLVATLGALMIATGMLVFVANVLWSRKRGAAAGDNPWDAESLEWLTPSPPPPYNFLHVPVVSSRWPLWDQNEPGVQESVEGLRSDRREVLVTSVLDARPQRLSVLARPSLAPAALAVATSVAFIGAIWDLRWVLVGAGLAFVVMAYWHWPRHDERTPPWKGTPS